MNRLLELHHFLSDKNIYRTAYFVVAILGMFWVMYHYNMGTWGLPLTDDQGHPLYRH